MRDAEKDGVVGSYGRAAIAPGSRITASRAETDGARDGARSSIANSKAQMLESLQHNHQSPLSGGQSFSQTPKAGMFQSA